MKHYFLWAIWLCTSKTCNTYHNHNSEKDKHALIYIFNLITYGSDQETFDQDNYMTYRFGGSTYLSGALNGYEILNSDYKSRL